MPAARQVARAQTPVSRLRVGLELDERKPDPKLKAELARDIAELDLLIDEILLTSRLDAVPSLQLEPIDLLGLAAEECAHYEECTLTGEPVAIRGDARVLRRLIRNLLDNARRHGAPPLTVQVGHEGGKAVLQVMDAGQGVPAADRDQVFTPFHRIGGESRGAGLGLALVRQIARLHGGEAEVAPRPASRAVFASACRTPLDSLTAEP